MFDRVLNMSLTASTEKIAKQTNSKKKRKEKALVRLVGFYSETIDAHHVFFIFVI